MAVKKKKKGKGKHMPSADGMVSGETAVVGMSIESEFRGAMGMEKAVDSLEDSDPPVGLGEDE